MAKLRRAVKARTTSNRKSARKPRTAKAAKKRPQAASRRAAGTARSRKTAPRKVSKPASKPAKAAVKSAPKPIKAVAKPEPPAPPPPPPAPPPRKPTYHEAVAMYERGLQALQRRDFAASAEALRNVIARYPDERELLERARLYLKVCERELEPKEPAPKTPDELVYAATVALNAGDEAAALRHVQRAITDDPRHSHAHYMMAVLSVRKGDAGSALAHLRHAVAIDPENRSLARQDAELEALRDDATFKSIVEMPAGEAPRAVAARPKARPRR